MILERLELSLVPDEPVTERDLRRCVGTYRDGNEGTRECSVELRHGGLVLHGVLWPHNRLLPKAPGVFVIAFKSAPPRLCFFFRVQGLPQTKKTALKL